MTSLRRLSSSLTIILILATLSSCSKSKHFEITGALEELGMQQVSITYFADGGFKHTKAPATDGHFALRGESVAPTLCIVEVEGSGEIATLIVQNGDKIKLSGSLNNPLAIEVKGNSASSKIAKWTADNATTITGAHPDAINEAVAKFVGDNRSDIAATALMVTRFYTPGHEQLADSLFSLIKPEARTAEIVQNFGVVLGSQLTRHAAGEVRPMLLHLLNDSTFSFNPIVSSYSLLAFIGDQRAQRDTIIPRLRTLRADFPRRRLQLIEISNAPDSTIWKETSRPDSASWQQAWAPGTIASQELRRLAVPRIPFFIVSDSSGVQIYRGSSARQAINTIKTLIK